MIFNDLKAEIEIRNDLKVKSKISKAFALGYDTNLYRIVLELLLETTKSKHGYIGYLDEDGGIECLARRDDALTLEKHSDNEERIEKLYKAKHKKWALMLWDTKHYLQHPFSTKKTI